MTELALPIDDYDKAPASTAKLLNCYIEKLPPDAKSLALLTRTPGIATWASVGTGPIHGMLSALDSLFVVSGTKLYEVDENGAATLLGDIGPVSGTSGIDMDANTDSVVVVNEPHAYYWNGTTFGQITDADFTSRGAADVEFINNYLLFREPNSGRFFGADLGSATSFDSLQFATAEANPDEMVGMKVDHVQVIQLGKKSVEIWDNTGSAGFPFERAINGFVEIGCFNGRSVAKLDNSVVWLANDYTVRRLDGVTPVRISNHGIEAAIQNATISTASAFSYSQEGHLFYVLSFNEVTVVYDATTQKWHERQSFGLDRWSASCHASAYGYELVGSTENGSIGRLDKTTFTEWGNTQRMSWTYQPIYADGVRSVHDSIEVVLKTGVGLTTGQGSDPEMMSDYSDDSGLTWTSLPNKKIGQLGKYRTRVRWRKCGSTDSARVYRKAISDPIEVSVVDTQARIRGGRV
jgi:hypothetical protein